MKKVLIVGDSSIAMQKIIGISFAGTAGMHLSCAPFLLGSMDEAVTIQAARTIGKTNLLERELNKVLTIRNFNPLEVSKLGDPMTRRQRRIQQRKNK